MDAKSLGECVDAGTLNGQVFSSGVPVTGEMHVLYKVDRVEGDMLYIFPAKCEKRSLVVEKSCVGVLYRQHDEDVVYAE